MRYLRCDVSKLVEGKVANLYVCVSKILRIFSGVSCARGTPRCCRRASRDRFRDRKGAASMHGPLLVAACWIWMRVLSTFDGSNRRPKACRMNAAGAQNVADSRCCGPCDRGGDGHCSVRCRAGLDPNTNTKGSDIKRNSAQFSRDSPFVPPATRIGRFRLANIGKRATTANVRIQHYGCFQHVLPVAVGDSDARVRHAARVRQPSDVQRRPTMAGTLGQRPVQMRRLGIVDVASVRIGDVCT